MSATCCATARISRGYGPAWHFGSAPRDISGITFTDIDGATRTVARHAGRDLYRRLPGGAGRQDRRRDLPERHGALDAAPVAVGGEVLHQHAGRHPGRGGRARGRPAGIGLHPGARELRLSRRDLVAGAGHALRRQVQRGLPGARQRGRSARPRRRLEAAPRRGRYAVDQGPHPHPAAGAAARRRRSSIARSRPRCWAGSSPR